MRRLRQQYGLTKLRVYGVLEYVQPPSLKPRMVAVYLGSMIQIRSKCTARCGKTVVARGLCPPSPSTFNASRVEAHGVTGFLNTYEKWDQSRVNFPLVYGPLYRNAETPWSKEQIRLRTEGLTSARAQTTAERNGYYGFLGPAGLRSGGAHAYQRHRSSRAFDWPCALCILGSI